MSYIYYPLNSGAMVLIINLHSPYILSANLCNLGDVNNLVYSALDYIILGQVNLSNASVFKKASTPFLVTPSNLIYLSVFMYLFFLLWSKF
jgi:hypothetical protein